MFLPGCWLGVLRCWSGLGPACWKPPGPTPGVGRPVSQQTLQRRHTLRSAHRFRVYPIIPMVQAKTALPDHPQILSGLAEQTSLDRGPLLYHTICRYGLDIALNADALVRPCSFSCNRRSTCPLGGLNAQRAAPFVRCRGTYPLEEKVEPALTGAIVGAVIAGAFAIAGSVATALINDRRTRRNRHREAHRLRRPEGWPVCAASIR